MSTSLGNNFMSNIDTYNISELQQQCVSAEKEAQYLQDVISLKKYQAKQIYKDWRKAEMEIAKLSRKEQKLRIRSRIYRKNLGKASKVKSIKIVDVQKQIEQQEKDMDVQHFEQLSSDLIDYSAECTSQGQVVFPIDYQFVSPQKPQIIQQIQQVIEIEQDPDKIYIICDESEQERVLNVGRKKPEPDYQ